MAIYNKKNIIDGNPTTIHNLSIILSSNIYLDCIFLTTCNRLVACQDIVQIKHSVTATLMCSTLIQAASVIGNQ